MQGPDGGSGEQEIGPGTELCLPPSLLPSFLYSVSVSWASSTFQVLGQALGNQKREAILLQTASLVPRRASRGLEVSLVSQAPSLSRRLP